MMSDVGTTMNSLINHAGHSMVTNVPGQSFNMHFSGAKLVDMTGLMMIFDGLGLNHVINSYAGKLYISPVSCPQMMPDMDNYSQGLRDSFSALYQQACPEESKAVAPAKPRAKRAPAKRAPTKRAPAKATQTKATQTKTTPAKTTRAKTTSTKTTQAKTAKPRTTKADSNSSSPVSNKTGTAAKKPRGTARASAVKS